MHLPFRQSTTTRGAAESYLYQLKNLLLVRGEGDGKVIICALANNLTPEQQDASIRYLCAEGFLAGDLEPLGRFHERMLDLEEQPVRWIIDPSWPSIDPSYALHIKRLCWYTAGTMMI